MRRQLLLLSLSKIGSINSAIILTQYNVISFETRWLIALLASEQFSSWQAPLRVKSNRAFECTRQRSYASDSVTLSQMNDVERTSHQRRDVESDKEEC